MKNHHLTLDKPEINSPDNTSQDSNQPFHAFDDQQILDFNPLCMGLPSFAADPNSSETKQLKIKYKKQYKEIIHLYEGRDFLEVTLQKLTEKSPPAPTKKSLTILADALSNGVLTQVASSVPDEDSIFSGFSR